jgi:hypothetical protein
MSKTILLPSSQSYATDALVKICKSLFMEDGFTVQTYGLRKHPIILIGKSWIIGAQILYHPKNHALVISPSFGRKSAFWLGSGLPLVLLLKTEARNAFAEMVYQKLNACFQQ